MDAKDDPNYDRIEHAEEQAAAKGLVVVLPKPNELLVDIDDEQGWNTFLTNIERLRTIRPCTYVVGPSPSGRQFHRHVTVSFEDYRPTMKERVLLQALLGSDRVREMLSFQRILRGNKCPTLFFEKP